MRTTIPERSGTAALIVLTAYDCVAVSSSGRTAGGRSRASCLTTSCREVPCVGGLQDGSANFTTNLGAARPRARPRSSPPFRVGRDSAAAGPPRARTRRRLPAPNGGLNGMYPCPIGAPTARTSRTGSTTVTCLDATARTTHWDLGPDPLAELDHRWRREVQRREPRRCCTPDGHQRRTQPVRLVKGVAQ